VTAETSGPIDLVRSDRSRGFFVKFWGTRGSIPAPGYSTRRYGGNTSCVELRIDGKLFICDAGSGLRDLGGALLRERGDEEITAHIFFSHFHWDHIQGFPFFAPVYLPRNTFHIYGNSPGDRRQYQLLSGQMQSDYFPVAFSDLGARIEPDDLGDAGRIIDGVRVTALEQMHPGRSWAFSFEKEGRKAVYATDCELDLGILNKVETAADPSLLRRMPAELIDFVRDADLLIADGQYTDEEYPEKVGWGHPRCTTVVDLAIQAEARQVALFHHDPMQSDDDVERKVKACRKRARGHGVDLTLFAAREGVELKLYG
jgi:phosphoribosyl 1,2-cyclic phosphodiesterase